MRRVIFTIGRRELRATWRARLAAVVAVALATSTVAASVAFADRLARAVDDAARSTVAGADVVVRRHSSLATPFGDQRARIDGSTVDLVLAVPGVAGATARVTGPVRLLDHAGRTLAGDDALAGNWPGPPFSEQWDLVAGHPPSSPHDVVLVAPAPGAPDVGPGPGDDVTLVGNGSQLHARVSGLVRAAPGGGPSRLAALVVLPAAQQLLGQPGQVDEVQVVGAPGGAGAELVGAVVAALPPGLDALTTADAVAAERGRAGRELRLVWAVLAAVAGLAVLTGLFVVANTLRVAAAERSSALALLRVVGASPGQLRRLVLVDAALVGVAGSLVGAASGLAASRGPEHLARAAGWRLPAGFGAGAEPAGATRAGLGGLTGLAGDPRLLARAIGLSLAVGLVPTVLAALGAARVAARASPLAALGAARVAARAAPLAALGPTPRADAGDAPGQPAAGSGRPGRRGGGERAAFGVVAALAGTGLGAGVWWVALDRPAPAATGAVVLWGIATAVLAPTLARPLAFLVGSQAVRTGLALVATMAMVAAAAIGLASAIDGFGAGLGVAGGLLATAGTVAFAAQGATRRRGGGVAARLARRAVADQPTRSGSASAGWTIGVASVCAVVVVAASAQASVVDGFASAYRGDVVIDAGPGARPTAAGLDHGLAAAARATPGVAAAAGWRLTFAQVAGTTVAIPAIEPAALDELFVFRLRAGSLGELDEASVAVSSGEARRSRLEVGDELAVTFATTGAQRFRVAAIFDDPGLDVRYLLSSRAQERHFAERADLQVFVRFDPHADRWSTRQALADVVAAHPGARMVSAGAFAAEAGQRVTDAFGVVLALVAFVVVVAVIGVANASALSVVTRRRELALLRLVGAGRAQLATAVRWETVVLALSGAVPGTLFGVCSGAVVARALAGHGVDRVVVPGALVGAVAAASVVAGVAASILPARRAVRVEPLSAAGPAHG